MYILNVSFMVDYDAHDKWLGIMRQKFIPFVQSNKFTNLVFTRVISNDSADGFTYSLQIPMEDLEGYNTFNDSVMTEYVSISSAIFGDKVLHFASLLKIVEI